MTVVTCAQQGCSGQIEDGYCNTCGLAPSSPSVGSSSTAGPARAPEPLLLPSALTGSSTSFPIAANGPAAAATDGSGCDQPGCAGTISGGYCDTCGMAPTAASAASRPATAGTISLSPVTSSQRTGRSRSIRARIGAGLVDVPTVPASDPGKAVMKNPEVPEDKRFCSGCGEPVGRAKAGKKGRVEGFCGKCRTRYSFVPKLSAGDLVGGQYSVAGPIAHGGLGWIYLARDRNVNDRWVVLKGLLDAGSEDAMLAAVAEKRFLAEVQHGSIVEIHNFVTHEGAGYIVMEYVGGKSLKTILKERLKANGDRPDPLPIEQAIAYVLGVLPAIGYLHTQGLVYCDMKPDNVIQTGDDVKIIDLGGVRRLDDATGAIYGTVGFQAPEIAEVGPSISSDLYTVARTLAVLILDFRGYQSRYATSLPPRSEHPVLADNESLYRFLLKGTAASPVDRFQSTEEMGEQLLGILREIVARRTAEPRPGVSTLFTGDGVGATTATTGSGAGTDWRLLPTLKVDPSDPAATFLLGSATTDPARVAEFIQSAVAEGLVTESQETNLRLARALLDLGDTAGAGAALDRATATDPRDWRVWWHRGLAALESGDFANVSGWFDPVYTALPGELAPKLALGLGAELAGDLARASSLYETVAVTDPASFTSATFGLARCRIAGGDHAAAVEAYGRVPRSSSAWVSAQVDAARVLIRSAAGGSSADQLVQASQTVERLSLDARQRVDLERELFEAALALVTTGTAGTNEATLLGAPMDETAIRENLERSYRSLARFAPTQDERFALVDRANQVRPKTMT